MKVCWLLSHQLASDCSPGSRWLSNWSFFSSAPERVMGCSSSMADSHGMPPRAKAYCTPSRANEDAAATVRPEKGAGSLETIPAMRAPSGDPGQAEPAVDLH